MCIYLCAPEKDKATNHWTGSVLYIYIYISLTQVDMEVNKLPADRDSRLKYKVKNASPFLAAEEPDGIQSHPSYHFRDNVNSSACCRWPCCFGALDRASHRLGGLKNVSICCYWSD